jgi:hypothetical protein
MEQKNVEKVQPQPYQVSGPGSGVSPQDDVSPDPSAIPAAIMSGLLPALRQAGSLVLLPAEIEALRAPFPASAVRTKPSKHGPQTYIPHTEISRRLTTVLGTAWAVVRVREWIDPPTQVVYGSYCLIVRGCWIADTVAGQPYYAGNVQQDYADVLEATRGIALRRMAAKSCLGCGDQAWPHDDGQEQPPAMPPAIRMGRPAMPAPMDAGAAQAIKEAYTHLDQRAVQYGTDALKRAWEALTPEMRRALAADLPTLKARAQSTDEAGEARVQPDQK